MPEFTGLTDDEKDRLRDWWDEETTVSVESVFPEVARIVIARMADAWDEGFKQGGPMHDENHDDPDAHTRNPYRAAETVTCAWCGQQHTLTEDRA